MKNRPGRSNWVLTGFLSLTLFLQTPSLFAGQASRQYTNYLESQKFLSPNESQLSDYQLEREAILKSLTQNKSSYVLKQKLKILNNKISYLQNQIKKTSPVRKTVQTSQNTQKTAKPLSKAPVKRPVSSTTAKKSTASIFPLSQASLTKRKISAPSSSAPKTVPDTSDIMFPTSAPAFRSMKTSTAVSRQKPEPLVFDNQIFVSENEADLSVPKKELPATGVIAPERTVKASEVFQIKTADIPSPPSATVSAMNRTQPSNFQSMSLVESLPKPATLPVADQPLNINTSHVAVSAGTPVVHEPTKINTAYKPVITEVLKTASLDETPKMDSSIKTGALPAVPEPMNNIAISQTHSKEKMIEFARPAQTVVPSAPAIAPAKPSLFSRLLSNKPKLEAPKTSVLPSAPAPIKPSDLKRSEKLFSLSPATLSPDKTLAPENTLIPSAPQPPAEQLDVKRGSDWLQMSHDEKEMYVFAAMGALVKHDVVSMKPSYYYIQVLDDKIQNDPSAKSKELDSLFVSSIYEREPDTRSSIDKIRQSSGDL